MKKNSFSTLLLFVGTAAGACEPAPSSVLEDDVGRGAAEQADDCELEITTQSLASHVRLIVEGSARSDEIRVSESAGELVVETARGRCVAPSSDHDELVVLGGRGHDVITLEDSVRTPAILYGGPGRDRLQSASDARTTLVTIGGGVDEARGNGSRTSFWVGGEDSTNASASDRSAGRLHTVDAFENSGIALDGPRIEDDERYQRYADSPVPWSHHRLEDTSLWGVGLPEPFDVQQGFFQRCHTTARWASIVDQQPARVRELAVELGDGTYAVQVADGRFVRVDRDTLPFHLSRPGPTGRAWYVVLEKAYSSLNLDFPEPTEATFVETIRPSDYEAGGYLESVADHLDAGRTLVANSIGLDLDIGISRFHVHSVVGADPDAGTITVRNPYGDVIDAVWRPEPNPAHGVVELGVEQFEQYFTDIKVTETAIEPAR